MAISPQRPPIGPILRPHFPRISHLIPLPTRVRCSATAPAKRSLKIGPRPPLPNGNDQSSLKSTWSHWAWVAGGCTTVLVSLAKSFSGAASSHVWLEPILAGLLGYVLADLGSGIYHWGIDNYGGPNTRVFGSQIEAFQGHHKWPWTITRRQFANNLHALARAVFFVVLPIDLACEDPVLLGFVGACSGCIMFSQQFHAWAHTTKSRLPPVVAALQDGGVLVSRSQHAAHHRPPYSSNYCIVSGVWNEVLDGSRFFEALEMAVYFRFGVRPRSWDDPTSDWTEDGRITSLESP
ncbi:Kua-ubiquitin conjugating enzyme hybridlocalisation domain [Striga asiatica]|uniref:Kua-ubiquitin conjugating enzyme hybridlocalisation domain n=1 Tax=Striga asiatica TaxID=4170 RepID=A0A5A7PJY0_STRAF|nr:Kua-ubiquitin conjugating enzyme hybridlocalisation domain [Striga asiatica]